VLGRDARPVIGNRQDDAAAEPGILLPGKPDTDLATAVLHRVLDQVLDHPGELIGITGHRIGAGPVLEPDRRAAGLGGRPLGVDHLPREGSEIDHGGRRHVLAQLDPG
jgi:hypothetical protein